MKKVKNIKHDLIVLPGDVVSLDLNHISNPEERYITGTILDIEERLECCNSGQTRVDHLITLLIKTEDPEVGKISYYDRSYVTKVLFRPKKDNQVPLLTIKSPNYQSVIKSKGKVSMMDITSISEQILKFFVSKEFLVDPVKLINLYKKNQFPGYRKDGKINFKIFKKWVLQNANNIKRTRFEIFKYLTERNTIEEDEYYNSLDDEYCENIDYEMMEV